MLRKHTLLLSIYTYIHHSTGAGQDPWGNNLPGGPGSTIAFVVYIVLVETICDILYIV